MQDTELGWILAGRFQTVQPTNALPLTPKTFFLRSDVSLERQLQRFWELEELNQSPRTKKETDCEQHFISSTIRYITGRSIVRLPFRQDPTQLGGSRSIAITRLQQLESRLARYPRLRTEYTRFLVEYESLGHMSVVNK
jgi:hypothetical protein